MNFEHFESEDSRALLLEPRAESREPVTESAQPFVTLGRETTRQKFRAADILIGLPPRKPLLYSGI